MSRKSSPPLPNRGIRYGYRHETTDNVSTYEPIEGLNPLPKFIYNDTRVIATALDDKGVVSHVSPRFASTPYIAVINIIDKAVTNVKSLLNLLLAPKGESFSYKSMYDYKSMMMVGKIAYL